MASVRLTLLISVFQDGGTILQSHHQYMRILLALPSYQVLAHLIDTWRYVIVGLVGCISTMDSDWNVFSCNLLAVPILHVCEVLYCVCSLC